MESFQEQSSWIMVFLSLDHCHSHWPLTCLDFLHLLCELTRASTFFNLCNTSDFLSSLGISNLLPAWSQSHGHRCADPWTCHINCRPNWIFRKDLGCVDVASRGGSLILPTDTEKCTSAMLLRLQFSGGVEYDRGPFLQPTSVSATQLRPNPRLNSQFDICILWKGRSASLCWQTL